MADNPLSTTALLVVVGAMFLGASIQVYVEHGFKANRRLVPNAVIGVVMLAASFWWSSIAARVPVLASSVSSIASDARVWFAIILLVWLRGVFIEVLLMKHRDRLSEVIEKDIIPFRRALERWVIPRRLTPDQIVAIGAYLRSQELTPHVVTVVADRNDDEASKFASDIVAAIEDGNWTARRVEPSDRTLRPGVSISFKHTMDTATKRQDPRNPKPDDILQKAFRNAGFEHFGSGGGSGVNVAQDDLSISVGPRQRGSSAHHEQWPF